MMLLKLALFSFAVHLRLVASVFRLRHGIRAQSLSGKTSVPPGHNASLKSGRLRSAAPNSSWQKNNTAVSHFEEVDYHDVSPKQVYSTLSSRSSANRSEDQTSVRDYKYKILLFWAVRARDDIMWLVKKNIRHAREKLPVDVYLAHYDHGRETWLKAFGEHWYGENVDFYAQQSGYKYRLMIDLLAKGSFSLFSYQWVWALDEDVDFTRTPLIRMIGLADSSKSLIALPSFEEVDRPFDVMAFPFQRPHNCDFRYVPMVEGIFPLIRPQVVAKLDECTHCLHDHSAWGLCRVWCAWSANKLGRDRNTACAVIDDGAVVHRNFRTLKGKYAGTGVLEDTAWVDRSWADFRDVQAFHPQEFVEGKVDDPWQWKCMRQVQVWTKKFAVTTTTSKPPHAFDDKVDHLLKNLGAIKH